MPAENPNHSFNMLFNYGGNSAVEKFFLEEDKQYATYTGADLTAYFGHRRVGKLQAITCSISRETLPLYTMGSANPKAFNRGKRGIAGNMVFTQFDRHAILNELVDPTIRTFSDLWNKDAIASQNMADLGPYLQGSGQQYANLFPNYNLAGIRESQLRDIAQTMELVKNQRITYVDQLPPFDVTITFVNEMGYASSMVIHGVQLINEGIGWSQEDMTSDTAYTYLAKGVTPLDTVQNIVKRNLR